MRSRGGSIVGTVSSARHGARPRGVDLARKLRAEIEPRDWVPGEIQLGRGSGFCISFRRGVEQIEVAVAVAEERSETWAVQIAPARLPGPIARALGRAPSATSKDVLELARAAHAVLKGDARFAGVRWRWEAFQDEASATREPAEPPAEPGRRRSQRRRRAS